MQGKIIIKIIVQEGWLSSFKPTGNFINERMKNIEKEMISSFKIIPECNYLTGRKLILSKIRDHRNLQFIEGKSVWKTRKAFEIIFKISFETGHGFNEKFSKNLENFFSNFIKLGPESSFHGLIDGYLESYEIERKE